MEKANQREDLTDKIVKIVCPRAEELCVIINNVRCDECGLSFSNEPRLRMHVLKTHEHKNLKKITIKEDVRYHCPEIMCVYALKSQRYFATMKYLKQHYLKVHAAKKFPCSKCDKSFSTEAASLAHLRICGVKFVCSCLRIFGTYEALLTHGKRASHTIDEKYKKAIVRKPRAKSPQFANIVKSTIQRINKPITILPRTIGRSLPTSAIKIAFDVAVQTDDIKLKKRTPSPSKTCKRRESRQTQTSGSTSREKRARKTVETQTIQNSRSSSSSSCSSSSRKFTSQALGAAVKLEKSSFIAVKREKVSFVTGDENKSSPSLIKEDLGLNENFTSDNLFPSSPLVLRHDVALQDYWEEKNTSLGTQTNPSKIFQEDLSDGVTRTNLVTNFYEPEVADNCLNINGKVSAAELVYTEDTTENDDTTACYSYETRGRLSRSDPMLTIDNFHDRFNSIETQTEIAASRENFFDSTTVDCTSVRNFALSSNNETQTTENFDNIEQLLYSNTCTQTCNDILPRDLGLSDIQTQTAWTELEDSSLITAETQTLSVTSHDDGESSTSSCCRSSWLSTRISHTETQTDLFSIFDEFT